MSGSQGIGLSLHQDPRQVLRGTCRVCFDFCGASKEYSTVNMGHEGVGHCEQRFTARIRLLWMRA